MQISVPSPLALSTRHSLIDDSFMLCRGWAPGQKFNSDFVPNFVTLLCNVRLEPVRLAAACFAAAAWMLQQVLQASADEVSTIARSTMSKQRAHAAVAELGSHAAARLLQGGQGPSVQYAGDCLMVLGSDPIARYVTVACCRPDFMMLAEQAHKVTTVGTCSCGTCTLMKR